MPGTSLVSTHTLDRLDANLLELQLAQIGQRLDEDAFANVVLAMAHTRAQLYGIERLDANETALFGRDLEYISARLREIHRPQLKWRQFVPVTSEAPAGAETWSYKMWDALGMAEIVANYADDIRRVGVTAQKFTYDIATWALGYDYTVLDIERASMAGVNYQNQQADAVRRGFELRFERIASLGQTGTNIKGLLNHPNVPVIAATTVGAGSAWGAGTKTPDDVLKDMIAAEDSIVTATQGVESPDTLLLPLAKFRYIQNTPVYTGAGSDPEDTILSVYLRRSAYVTNVDWWLPLATANSAGTGARALWYRRDPRYVHFELTMPPRELPPQTKNLALSVESWTRAGGVCWEYPLSAVYMDGI
jgi:hypothetical protein